MMIDASEHILDGPFTRQAHEWSFELELEEISPKDWQGYQSNTHTSGSKPIDGVWLS